MRVNELIQREPWRLGQGRPYTALDPTWTGTDLVVCHGEISWEHGGKWWFCRECGYCSCWTQTLHYRTEHPTVSYQRNLDFFYRRRAEQGMSREEAERQALHIAGAALKAAAMLPPSECGRFVDEVLPR